MLQYKIARWWDTHKHYIFEWSQCRILMDIKFGEQINYFDQKYTGLTNFVEHIEHSYKKWQEYP